MTISLQHPLLVVEDSDEDYLAFQRMVQQSHLEHPIVRCLDGDEALDYLYHRGAYNLETSPRPAVILLDLNLPGLDGRDVLAQLKGNDQLKTIPVVIFTTSSNPKDVERCYQWGVNGYILKPIDLNKLRRSIQLFVDYWFEATLLPTSDSIG